MFRVGLLFVLVGAAGLPSLPNVGTAGDAKKSDALLSIERGGGFVNPDDNPFAHYGFTLAKDGAWELKPLKGATKKGKLDAGDVMKWVKAIDDGGFQKLKSNPALGAADEPYMEITVQLNDKKETKRIPLQATLAQTLDKKILEFAKAGR